MPWLPPAERLRACPALWLPGAQATALAPLAARAFDAGLPRSRLRDHAARRLARRLGVDHAAVDPRRVHAVTLRSRAIDAWVRAFLAAHPAGTVVELGAGLSTRFERLDRGRQRWLALDLAGIVELRRRHLAPSPRRAHVATAGTDTSWLAHLAGAPGPCCLVLEAVLAYLPRAELPDMLARLAAALPGATLVLDAPRAWGDAPRAIAEGGLGWALEEAVELAPAAEPAAPAGPAALAALAGAAAPPPPVRLARFVSSPGATTAAPPAPAPPGSSSPAPRSPATRSA